MINLALPLTTQLKNHQKQMLRSSVTHMTHGFDLDHSGALPDSLFVFANVGDCLSALWLLYDEYYLDAVFKITGGSRHINELYDSNVETEPNCTTRLLIGFWIFLTLSVARNWAAGKADVKNAFRLFGRFSRDVYVRPPHKSKNWCLFFLFLAFVYDLFISIVSL